MNLDILHKLMAKRINEHICSIPFIILESEKIDYVGNFKNGKIVITVSEKGIKKLKKKYPHWNGKISFPL